MGVEIKGTLEEVFPWIVKKVLWTTLKIFQSKQIGHVRYILLTTKVPAVLALILVTLVEIVTLLTATRPYHHDVCFPFCHLPGKFYSTVGCEKSSN